MFQLKVMFFLMEYNGFFVEIALNILVPDVTFCNSSNYFNNALILVDVSSIKPKLGNIFLCKVVNVWGKLFLYIHLTKKKTTIINFIFYFFKLFCSFFFFFFLLKFHKIVFSF